jgi:hypothetical protein
VTADLKEERAAGEVGREGGGGGRLLGRMQGDGGWRRLGWEGGSGCHGRMEMQPTL